MKYQFTLNIYPREITTLERENTHIYIYIFFFYIYIFTCIYTYIYTNQNGVTVTSNLTSTQVLRRIRWKSRNQSYFWAPFVGFDPRKRGLLFNSKFRKINHKEDIKTAGATTENCSIETLMDFFLKGKYVKCCLPCLFLFYSFLVFVSLL